MRSAKELLHLFSIFLKCPKCESEIVTTAIWLQCHENMDCRCGHRRKCNDPEILQEIYKAQDAAETLYQQMEMDSERSPYNLCDHPDHAAALGRLVANWSTVENSLCGTLAFLMRTPYWYAHSAYHAVVSNRARIEMLLALTPLMVGGATYRQRCIDLLTKAREVGETRNGFVHATWMEQKGNVYIIENMEDIASSQKRRVHPQEIQDAVAEVTELYVELERFNFDYSYEHPVWYRDGTPEALQRRFVRLSGGHIPDSGPNEPANAAQPPQLQLPQG
jgi:hypothetical protein